MNKFIPILVVILVSIITVVGDFFIKLSGSAGTKFIRIGTFTLGLFFYFLTAFGWFFVMKHIKLASIGVIYGITTALLLAIIGYFFFSEHLSYFEIFGILLGIIAIFILSRFAS